jgi:hypothetical protein
MVKIITSKNLKTFFPRGFPKDIIGIIDNYLYDTIRQKSKKLYSYITEDIIGSILIPEKYFTKKITKAFVKNIGSSFEDFLSLHHEDIRYDGYEIISKVSNYIFRIFCPEYGFRSEILEEIDKLIDDFVVQTLTTMAVQEGYLAKKSSVNNLQTYLDSLIEQ